MLEYIYRGVVMERFGVVIVLTVIIHLVSTLAYSVRLSGVRSQRLLTAFSLYNIIYILASTSSTFQIPLLTSMMEHGIRAGSMQAGFIVPDNQLLFQEEYRRQLTILAERIRIVILAATLGTVMGALMIPPFVNIFARATQLFEETGSLYRVLIKLTFTHKLWRARCTRMSFSFPYGSVRQLAGQKLSIPKNFLLTNIIVTGLYTTGIVSALYAGALFPEFRSTAASLSAVVNGFATVLGAMVVEPTASSITDEVLRGDRDEADVKQMTFYLAITRLTGTIFAQILFLPGAYLIKLCAQLLA